MNKRYCNNLCCKKQSSYLRRPFNVLPRTNTVKEIHIVTNLNILTD